MKSIQYFSDEYLRECKKMSSREILDFVENFRRLIGEQNSRQNTEKSILISLKIPENLLSNFRKQCEGSNIKYQTQIKKLMQEWLISKY